MSSLPRNLLLGLVAGAGATYVKSQAEAVLQPLGERLLPPAPGAKAKLGADPVGQPEDMPPSELADRAQRPVTGEPLSDDQREQASGALHWVMGVGSALAYAATIYWVPPARAGRGLAAGAVLFAATHGSGLPLAGLQPSPTAMPRAWWIWEPGSHLVYGLALDAGLSTLDAVFPG